MSLVRRSYRGIHVDGLPRNFYKLHKDHGLALFAAGTVALVFTCTTNHTYCLGCFWGVESLFRQEFESTGGLLHLCCVYTGDAEWSVPIYTSLGDHAEAILIKYDSALISYATLVSFFFSMHDPTERNRQGNDVGRQYRSCIYTFSEDQMKIARSIRNGVDLHYKSKVNGQLCCTKILTAHQEQIWPAERKHQQYLHKNPEGYKCHAHYKRDITTP